MEKKESKLHIFYSRTICAKDRFDTNVRHTLLSKRNKKI